MRLEAALVFWGAAAASFGIPDLLIHQQRVDQETSRDDDNQLLAPYLAQALDDDGRVRPVVWSMTDPVFRQWAETDSILVEAEQPDERTVLRVASRRRIEYVVFVSAVKEGPTLRPRGRLFRAGRLVWKFEPKAGLPQGPELAAPMNRADMDRLIAEANRRLTDGGAIAVTVNGATDWDLTSRTIAQTWVRQFNEGPLKSLPARAKTPEAPVAETPRGAEIQPSSPDWQTLAASFVAEGKLQQALAFLRDRVDADPSDPKARMALSDLYHRLGQPMEAARSAALAAEFARNPETWVVSAQRWLESGDAAQAQAALAKAVALGASPDLVRPHQITLHLLTGQMAEAEVQLRGLAPGSYPLQRALVEVLVSKPSLGPEAAAALEKRPLSVEEYSLFVLCLERSLMELTPKIRDLVPRARLEPNSSALLNEAEDSKVRLSALSSLVQAVVPPERHQESHESRRLALILLSQSSMVVQAFVRSNDPDQAEEAALSLSEAARIAQAVREAYAAESRRAN
ncbi:MAG: hypothetical protein KF884_02650 [Fimbriimonadaceae bacterium]|nr:hypothetical protein [Fimbriimonadaceae bacterium]QYK58995.1 MAG: hypothetical protein KF884_02650 [Fimbriimonadaceae bacterium]